MHNVDNPGAWTKINTEVADKMKTQKLCLKAGLTVYKVLPINRNLSVEKKIFAGDLEFFGRFL